MVIPEKLKTKIGCRPLRSGRQTEQICDLLLPLSTMEPGGDLLLVFLYGSGNGFHLWS